MVLATFVWVVWSFTSAVSFDITFWANGRPARLEYVERNITPIHFKDNWNDFAWFIYFSNVSTLDDEEDLEEKYLVDLWGDEYECFQKVKWYYYNAERGERLWPLDDSYNSIQGLTISGGLYTRCRKAWYIDALTECAWEGSEDKIEECEEGVRNQYADTHGYYWMIQHTYNGQPFVLLAGTNYYLTGINNSKWAHFTDKFAASLIRYDNKYPVWIIYDINWWAGLLWCKVLGDSHVRNVANDFINTNNDWTRLFSLSGNGVVYNAVNVLDCSDQWSAMNSLIKVIVDGLVWINRDTQNIGIIWNQSNEKMQYFSSVNINNTQLINYARQKAEILCRWKWNQACTNNICCFSWAGEALSSTRNGQLLIVKWRDVKISTMNDFDSDWYYNIFIDSWNLLIEPTDDSALKVFKRNGFISSTSTDVFKNGVLGIWGRTWSNYAKYTWEDISVWKFIKWNFIINWNIKAMSGGTTDGVLKDRYFVYGKMTTNDTVKELENVFKRWCRADGSSNMIDTNWYPCPLSFSGWNNPYEGASLVIIDQNYPSPLYD